MWVDVGGMWVGCGWDVVGMSVDVGWMWVDVGSMWVGCGFDVGYCTITIKFSRIPEVPLFTPCFTLCSCSKMHLQTIFSKMHFDASVEGAFWQIAT